jgi:hypothetical protein
LGGRDELNLAEFPITLLADRVPKGLKTVTYEDRIFDQQSNEMVTRRLTVTGSDRYGLPTAVDDEVLVALLQITKLANDFTSRDVHFTRYEVLKLLGWSDDGVNYRRIDESLKRWMGVTLYYDKAWWNKDAQAWVSEQFHILDNVSLVEQSVRKRLRARGQQELPLSVLTWNRVVFESFQADNLKRLDIDTYFRLSSSVAKRMFRFLDKRFYHRPRWEFDLQEFAFEHVGLSRSYADNGKLKEKLQPAIDELTDIGFIEPMSREERYEKLARGQWKVVFVKADSKTPRLNAPSAPEPAEFETKLISRGVSPQVAAELCSAHSEEFISLRLEVFDWLISRKDKRVSKSPAGYLSESIRKGYSPPKGFVSKAEREIQEAENRKRAWKAQEAKRRAEENEAAEEAKRKARIEGYLKSLSPPERKRCEEEALAAAPSFYHHQLRRNKADEKLTALYMNQIIEAHVTKLLEESDG